MRGIFLSHNLIQEKFSGKRLLWHSEMFFILLRRNQQRYRKATHLCFRGAGFTSCRKWIQIQGRTPQQHRGPWQRGRRTWHFSKGTIRLPTRWSSWLLLLLQVGCCVAAVTLLLLLRCGQELPLQFSRLVPLSHSGLQRQEWNHVVPIFFKQTRI